MIGVLADEAEHSVISEFFELFKTPWEFYRSTSHYDVLICSETSVQDSAAKLVFIYGGKPTTFDRENEIEVLSQRSNRVLSYKGVRIPIYGNCLTFKGEGVPLLTDECAPESAALEISSNGQRVVRAGFNLFHQIDHLLRCGQPLAQARIPTLELHIALIRDVIIDCSILLVEIPPLPANDRFIACLTHDVDHAGIRNHKCDHTVFGFLYRTTIGSLISFCRGRRSFRQLAANWMAAFSLPFVHLGWPKDFWKQFDRYIDLEKGATSTFFIIPKKMDAGEDAHGAASWKRATRYDVTDVAEQIQNLVSAGREIGLHGIDAWRSAAKGRAELETIQRATGVSEIGVRMHWLYFDEHSPAALESAGFSYDSTSGYNETIGYRAGTTQIFKPLQVERLLELPMHIMDTALFFPAYMNLCPKQAKSAIQPLLENADRFGGCLTINWHERSIAPERLWGDVYVGLLEELKGRGAWFATASDAVSWFRKRRSSVIESVTRDGETIRVRVSATPSNGNLPGLRLRAHKAPARPSSGFGQREYNTNFIDMEFNDSGEYEI